MSAPGFLAVISDPGSDATLEEFQDWYNNEHVPLRMNHLPSFLSGARYSAVDGKLPGWLAMYEIDQVETFKDPKYTILREKRSEREKELIGRLGVLDRRTAEVALDTGENEKSTGLRVGNPSPFVVTFGIGDVEAGKLQEVLSRTKELPAWIRTRIVHVFDSGVTGRNSQWTSIRIPAYLGVIELTSKIDNMNFEPSEQIEWRQWSLYKAYPGVAQGNV